MHFVPTACLWTMRGKWKIWRKPVKRGESMHRSGHETSGAFSLGHPAFGCFSHGCPWNHARSSLNDCHIQVLWSDIKIIPHGTIPDDFVGLENQQKTSCNIILTDPSDMVMLEQMKSVIHGFGGCLQDGVTVHNLVGRGRLPETACNIQYHWMFLI